MKGPQTYPMIISPLIFISSLALAQTPSQGIPGNLLGTTLDDYALSDKRAASASSIQVDLQGRLWVSGYASDSEKVNHWIIRMSSDQGKTWTNIEDISKGVVNEALQLSDGTQFVVGHIDSAWTVKRRLSNESTFTTVDELKSASAASIAATPLGQIYVFGSSETGSAKVKAWTVRRSLDHGATWTTIDTYLPEQASGAAPYEISVNGHGDIYLSGMVFGLNDEVYGITRRSIDGGRTFETVDRIGTDEASQIQAGGIQSIITLEDRTALSGGFLVRDDKCFLTLRKSEDLGKTWKTLFSGHFNGGDWVWKLAPLGRGKWLIAGGGMDQNGKAPAKIHMFDESNFKLTPLDHFGHKTGFGGSVRDITLNKNKVYAVGYWEFTGNDLNNRPDSRWFVRSYDLLSGGL